MEDKELAESKQDVEVTQIVVHYKGVLDLWTWAAVNKDEIVIFEGSCYPTKEVCMAVVSKLLVKLGGEMVALNKSQRYCYDPHSKAEVLQCPHQR